MKREDYFSLIIKADNYASDQCDKDEYLDWYEIRDNRFAELICEKEQNRIIALLNGIDKTENESIDGWWETSTGAEFGANIITQIKNGV